jgi:predicted MPP superfamily phosphohydrolase
MSAGLLEIGLRKALHIREERLSPQPDACRLMYVSDIHLRRGRSEILCRQVLESACLTKPDAILLGGDLIDRATELSELSNLVGALGDVAPVLAVGGNHDQHVGLDQVREAVIHGGGEWIHDGFRQVTHGSRVVTIFGPEAQSSPNTGSDVRVLCGHNPCIWKRVRHGEFDLVLAGHLHGCQCVAFEYRDRLFPGAIFYPYCFLTHQSGSTRLVVSRGVSDLVPIRWRCPREVIVCYV